MYKATKYHVQSAIIATIGAAGWIMIAFFGGFTLFSLVAVPYLVIAVLFAINALDTKKARNTEQLIKNPHLVSINPDSGLIIYNGFVVNDSVFRNIVMSQLKDKITKSVFND